MIRVAYVGYVGGGGYNGVYNNPALWGTMFGFITSMSLLGGQSSTQPGYASVSHCHEEQRQVQVSCDGQASHHDFRRV